MHLVIIRALFKCLCTHVTSLFPEEQIVVGKGSLAPSDWPFCEYFELVWPQGHGYKVCPALQTLPEDAVCLTSPGA